MNKSFVPTFFSNDFGNVDHCCGNKIYLENGEVYSDLTGGITSHSILGWGNEEFAELVKRQLIKYPHLDYKTFADPCREELAELLSSAVPSYYIQHHPKIFFPGSSGSDAMEAAVKLAYQYHCARGEHNRAIILTYSESYHGSTLGSLALGDRPNLKLYGPLLPKNIVRLEEVNAHRIKAAADRLSEHEVLTAALSELDRAIESIGGANVLCIVGETIAGGLTGYVPKPSRYWIEVERKCRQHGILLILDEVICGTGTTGTFYAWEQDLVSPDITVLGKTLCAGYLPLNALVVKECITDVIRDCDGRIQQSNTFQGHSCSTRLAEFVQRRINQPNFLERVRSLGEAARNFLADSLSQSRYFSAVAGRGLRFSVQLRGDDSNLFARYVTMQCEREFKLIVDGKWHRFTFSPQLDIDEQDLWLCLENFVKVFLSVENSKAYLSGYKPSNDLQKRY